MDASEALVNELQAEVEEQAALKEQDMTEAEKSVKWKKLQKEFKEHYKMAKSYSEEQQAPSPAPLAIL